MYKIIIDSILFSLSFYINSIILFKIYKREDITTKEISLFIDVSIFITGILIYLLQYIF